MRNLKRQKNEIFQLSKVDKITGEVQFSLCTTHQRNAPLCLRYCSVVHTFALIAMSFSQSITLFYKNNFIKTRGSFLLKIQKPRCQTLIRVI